MRLDVLPDDEWDDRTGAALAMLLPKRRRNVRCAGSILATLVRHPDLARAFVTFSTHLYEWHHHAQAAAEAV